MAALVYDLKEDIERFSSVFARSNRIIIVYGLTKTEVRPFGVNHEVAFAQGAGLPQEILSQADIATFEFKAATLEPVVSILL
ncbi:hypothetical protein ASG53_15485 [Sanguibacter sp. Leaf3]|nr:hypothetical protein ASG53_15485 [Sanguibacter sp. Leaf3]